MLLFGQIWGNLGKISCAHLKIAYVSIYVQDSAGHLDIQMNPRNRFEALNESMNYFAYKIVSLNLHLCIHYMESSVNILSCISETYIFITNLFNKQISFHVTHPNLQKKSKTNYFFFRLRT